MRTRSTPFAIVAVLMVIPAQGGVDVTATKSLAVQPNGPRTGDAGKKYFNIEGKDNDKYASFGVVVFEMPKEIDATKIKGVKLTLVQSVPRFAKDGGVELFLAPDLDPAADLKFDPKFEDGVGDRIKPLHELGSATFKKVKTGEMQSFTLTLDDSLGDRIAKGGPLCLVITPSDAAVAATFFGANEEDRRNKPKLEIELP